MRIGLLPALLALSFVATFFETAAAAAAECAEGRDSRGGNECGSAGEVGDQASLHRLVTQKVSLLRAYLDSASIRRVREDGHIEANALANEAEAYLETARRALAANRLDEAGEALDRGLRSASMASSLGTKPHRSPEQEKRKYKELDGQIRSYLESMGEALKNGSPADRSGETLSRVEKLVLEAERLAGTGEFGNANKILTEAYQMTVTMVSKLRKGTTLVSTLNFATAADELEYERRRNGSYEMLVGVMLDERQGGTKSLRQLADRYIGESRSLRERAEREAAAGDFRAAIDTMEEATSRLVRILQAGGLPVPE